MAKEQVPNHWSSQNLTFLPSLTFHPSPILATWAAQSTPFQKGELFLGLQQKMLGEAVRYLASIIFFHIQISQM
jgi:hypothetical protein